jgi:ABC-2 type transport system permease protein
MRRWADAWWGVIRRDAFVFVSYRTQLISQIFAMIFQLTIFHFISRLLHVHTAAFHNSVSYFGYVVVGLGISQVLILTLGLAPGRVRQELVAGTMERFMVSPFGVDSGVISMLFFPIFTGLIMATIMLLLAHAIFGLHLVDTAPLAIPVGLLGSVAFMPFALLLTAFVVAFKQLAAGATFITSGIGLIGGLYFPASLLPGWIRWTTYVQPFTPAVDLLRHLIVGTQLQFSAASDLLRLLGFMVVLTPPAMLLLRQSIMYGQRRGTIFEY